MNVTFVHRESIAEHIDTFWFKPEQPVRYIAGQFTEIYLPHDAVDSRGPRRWFTLSSSPTDPLVSITTKLSPQRSSSYKQTLSQLQAGDQLKLADPMGDFVLPKDPTIPLIFVAGGLGVTPVHSMIKWLHDTGEQRDVQLIYAAATDSELAFLPLLKAATARLTTVVRDPSADYKGETGSLSSARLVQLAQDTDRTQWFLSGPEPMVELFTKELPDKGIDADRIVTDYFPGYVQF